MATLIASDEVSSGPITLAANVEQVVEFVEIVPRAEVMVFTSTNPVYFTTDGTAAAVGGKHCYPLPAGIGAMQVDLPRPMSLSVPFIPIQVRIISAGTGTVFVTRI